jgi:lipoprotein-anchoring transpeptidase ErfK/SrfK
MPFAPTIFLLFFFILFSLPLFSTPNSSLSKELSSIENSENRFLTNLNKENNAYKQRKREMKRQKEQKRRKVRDKKLLQKLKRAYKKKIALIKKLEDTRNKKITKQKIAKQKISPKKKVKRKIAKQKISPKKKEKRKIAKQKIAPKKKPKPKLAKQKTSKNTSYSSRLLRANIDISQQRMRVYQGKKLLYTWKVSTARRGHRTPTGKYKAQTVKKMHYSSLYNNSPMPYTIFYDGNYAIHGTRSVRKLGRPASHGCVRLRTSNAKKLYTLVRKYGKKNLSINIVR